MFFKTWSEKLLQIVLKQLNNETCFLVGVLLEKRVDYRHGFSSVFFFDTPEVTKIVPQNFMVSNWTIWPTELNQKGFPFFPCNIHYRARLKGCLSDFFGIVRVFFSKFPPKGPLHFGVSWQNGCWKIPKGPLSVFRHCETFFIFFSGFCRREYLDTLKSFCFWALHMAPTWAGPGLLKLRV